MMIKFKKCSTLIVDRAMFNRVREHRGAAAAEEMKGFELYGWQAVVHPKVGKCCQNNFVVYNQDTVKYAYLDDLLRLDDCDVNRYSHSTKSFQGKFEKCKQCDGTGGLLCAKSDGLPFFLKFFDLYPHTCTPKCHLPCSDCNGSGASKIYEVVPPVLPREVVKFTDEEKLLLNYHVKL